MKSNTTFTIIFAVILAAVLIGEVFVYTMDQGRYSSDISLNGQDLEYSLGSRGSQPYSVLVLDNGDFEPIERYYIYYDPDYGSKVEKVQVPVGARELTQDYYISQLVKMLNNRGITDITIMNAEELRDAMAADGPDSSSKGLIVLSGALPYTIYNDEEKTNSLIFRWITDGGSMYWAGNLLGAYYSTADGGVLPVSFDYEYGFFGTTDCLNKGEENSQLSDIVSNGYRHSLSMMNNRVKYGVASSVPRSLAAGYTDGTYVSAAMVKLGDGMVCALAGDYSNNQRHDLAQIISSGICFSTQPEIGGYSRGEVKRGTVTGTAEVDFKPGVYYSVYIYYGNYFPVYGKTWGVKDGNIL